MEGWMSWKWLEVVEKALGAKTLFVLVETFSLDAKHSYAVLRFLWVRNVIMPTKSGKSNLQSLFLPSAMQMQ
ncbi:MAG TPA: hypothetical protein VL093_08280 [Flavipsychrobacter sp.]|nr:hypothetical protein [Flavipsychrobacter sp.]